MPTITFIKADGSEHALDVENGSTLMEIGRDNNMYLEAHAAAACPVQRAMFIFQMLIMLVLGRRLMMKWICLSWLLGLTETSRLGCQIRVEDTLDGLTVKVPDDL